MSHKPAPYDARSRRLIKKAEASGKDVRVLPDYGLTESELSKQAWGDLFLGGFINEKRLRSKVGKSLTNYRNYFRLQRMRDARPVLDPDLQKTVKVRA